MNFRENLKELRIKSNLTQQQLSNLLKIPLKTYRHYEQGESKTISFELLEKLTQVLNCSYNELLKEKGK
ncbi:MAG: helix-turn-helix domain-containing protein [Anaeroplasmataceae bacterium]|nr:helix-turn-helix domain-containing protein [Anaeroplasmataceae bacterium]